MVMMSARGRSLHPTFRLVAMLALRLGLDGHVSDAVLAQLLAHLLLNLMYIAVKNDVHRGVVALSVHAPHVNMMNILDTVNLQNVRFDLLNLNTLRDSFQKQRQDIL